MASIWKIWNVEQASYNPFVSLQKCGSSIKLLEKSWYIEFHLSFCNLTHSSILCSFYCQVWNVLGCFNAGETLPTLTIVWNNSPYWGQLQNDWSSWFHWTSLSSKLFSRPFFLLLLVVRVEVTPNDCRWMCYGPNSVRALCSFPPVVMPCTSINKPPCPRLLPHETPWIIIIGALYFAQSNLN